MANEISYEAGTTGLTLYAVARNAAGQAWNGSAFATYTTTRGDFDLALTDSGSTGFYGPINLPGSGTGRWWQIYLQAGGSPSHANDVRLATGYLELTTADIADAVAAQSDIAEAIETIDENLDAKVSEVEGGGGGGGTVIPVNQVPVPLSRTWILKQTNDGLAGELPLIRHVGEQQVFAIDFRNDLPTNGRVTQINQYQILSGAEGGIVISEDEEDLGVDRSQAKLTIELVTAGTYEIEVDVDYDASDGGGNSIATVILVAA
jgi:hypothetical protein